MPKNNPSSSSDASPSPKLVLTAKNNPNYGGPLINQKYSPLENIILYDDDKVELSKLFNTRIQVLTNSASNPPAQLQLFGNLPGANVAQAPMVVISSGRAQWMATILQNAVDHGAFPNGYLDTRTFDDDAVPWYAPGRSGRPLYVVVHWSEFDYYNNRLRGFANVTVVGYRFTVAWPALDIVGFGASRYAALQLMIQRGYHLAWAVDDNVVNINGFPRGLATVEAHIPLANPPTAIWGIGFTGATDNIDGVDLYNGKVKFNALPDNFATTTPGLLQQVVLWNVDLFRNAHLNFCPLFTTSNEDASLSNFLQATGRPERVITAYHIVKLKPNSDPSNNSGAHTEIPKLRTSMLEIFNKVEGSITINPGKQKVALRDYVTKTILGGAAQPSALQAQSQAIEMVLSAAVAKGAGYYPPTMFDNRGANVAVLAPADISAIAVGDTEEDLKAMNQAVSHFTSQPTDKANCRQ